MTIFQQTVVKCHLILMTIFQQTGTIAKCRHATGGEPALILLMISCADVRMAGKEKLVIPVSSSNININLWTC